MDFKKVDWPKVYRKIQVVGRKRFGTSFTEDEYQTCLLRAVEIFSRYESKDRCWKYFHCYLKVMPIDIIRVRVRDKKQAPTDPYVLYDQVYDAHPKPSIDVVRALEWIGSLHRFDEVIQELIQRTYTPKARSIVWRFRRRYQNAYQSRSPFSPVRKSPLRYRSKYL